MKTNKIKIVIMILFILAGITVSYAQQKEQTFNLGKNGKIEASINYGDIKVETWGKDQVSIKYDQDEDTDYASFKMVQNGSTLTISSSGYSSEDLVISLPSAISLDLNTSGGDIKINGNITGKVECSTSGGDIGTKDIDGNAYLKTAGGEIVTGKIDGDIVISSGGGDLQIGTVTGEADLNTGGGNVQVYNVTKDLKVRTGGGNVQSGDVGGVFEVTTGGGNISVKKVSSVVNVTTGGGNVSVGSAKGSTKASTGGGNLSFKNISGGVKCYTGSGDISVELNPDSKVNSEIKSGSGSITLYLPENSKATVVAKVRGWNNWGENGTAPIISEFKAATENKSSSTYKTTYQINGGGSTIEVETSSGEIYIKKQK